MSSESRSRKRSKATSSCAGRRSRRSRFEMKKSSTAEAPSVSLHATRNDLPRAVRAKSIALLGARLADCIDLQSQAKQAHWNVKGPSFIALHELFDKVYEDLGGHVDAIAERAVQLGGVVHGTI